LFCGIRRSGAYGAGANTDISSVVAAIIIGLKKPGSLRGWGHRIDARGLLIVKVNMASWFCLKLRRSAGL